MSMIKIKTVLSLSVILVSIPVITLTIFEFQMYQCINFSTKPQTPWEKSTQILPNCLKITNSMCFIKISHSKSVHYLSCSYSNHPGTHLLSINVANCFFIINIYDILTTKCMPFIWFWRLFYFTRTYQFVTVLVFPFHSFSVGKMLGCQMSMLKNFL